MKNITCIAIDDEPMALLVIEQFCRRKGGITLRTFSEPQIGLEAIRKQKPELVFLDIQMHSVNGLEIADTLPRECIFIFTTAYAEYALDGFNLDAVDFLHKPFSYERFEIAVGKALRRINTFTTVVPESIVVIMLIFCYRTFYMLRLWGIMLRSCVVQEVMSLRVII